MCRRVNYAATGERFPEANFRGGRPAMDDGVRYVSLQRLKLGERGRELT